MDAARSGARRRKTRVRSGRPVAAVLLAAALLASSCSGTDGSSGGDDGPGTDVAGERLVAEEPPGTGHCDDTDQTRCLLPWPSDTYTRSDPESVTGLRVDLPLDGMPTNATGVPVDPTEWNRNDGFSPASIAQVVIPDVDPEASRLPPQTDIGASIAPDSNLAVVDLETGERVPAWAEVDSTVSDPSTAPLRVVPATALIEGHTHAVGLWNLVRTDGTEVEPSEGFAAVLQDPDADQQQWLAALEEVGPPIGELDAAWSFTVASTESLTGRLRHMWAETAEDLGVQLDAEGATGGGAPPFTVTSSEQNGPVRVVQGSFEMPKYLTGDGGPGAVLDNDDDPDGLPTATGTMEAPFTCVVPAQAPDPVPFVLYGHGLLGDRSEVLDIGMAGASVGIGFCALDYIGMSSADIPTVLEEFQDLSRFRTQPDRLQQGHLAFLLLGRLLASSEGFATDPAFQDSDGSSMILPDGLTLLGASQGGILGGPATALSPDWNRAILAVGGLGYNLLLGRSVDFDQFQPVLEAAYPDQLDRALLLGIIEQLWDRGENAGWAQHLTDDPFPASGGTTTVMLLEAFGDHQVANVSTEKLARTLGVPRLAPTLAPRRSSDVEPYWGIEPIGTTPHSGSALVVWDFGTPAPPTANTPPREGDDPHGKLSSVPEALALVVAFAQPNGVVLDVCAGAPCSSPG